MESGRASLDPVLVIGGCGGLGQHILTQLLEEKHASQITAFDVQLPIHEVGEVHYIQGSIANKEDVHAAIDKVKPWTIFHTASPKMMHTSDPTVFDAVNITGTKLLLEALSEAAGTKLLIYTSSSSVVHDNQSDLAEANEDLPLCLEPLQPEHYTHTKAIAETMILEANGKHGLWTTSLRPCTLFGEYDTLTVPYMVELARAGRTKFQIGNDSNAFDYTYMGNMAYAEILAAQALSREATEGEGGGTQVMNNSEKINGEVFNISNDEHWTFWKLPRAIGAAAGYPTRQEDIWHIPMGVYYAIAVAAEWMVWLTSFGQRQSKLNRRMLKFTTMIRTFDISKAKQRLKYRPRVGMQDAVDRSVTWYMNQRAS